MQRLEPEVSFTLTAIGFHQNALLTPLFSINCCGKNFIETSVVTDDDAVLISCNANIAFDGFPSTALEQIDSFRMLAIILWGRMNVLPFTLFQFSAACRNKNVIPSTMQPCTYVCSEDFGFSDSNWLPFFKLIPFVPYA